MHLLHKQAAAAGFLVFLGLWVAGVIRTTTTEVPEPSALEYVGLSASRIEDISNRQQYANNWKQAGLGDTPFLMVIDQAEIEKIRVFEKSVLLALGSAAFEEDESRIRSLIARHQAVLFNEKSSGIAPARRVTLEIGVDPEKFDAFAEQLKEIGTLHSVTVEQRDRTTEFRKLHAQRQALKKYLEAIVKLRGAVKPSIEDALKLEQKIQDIEKELQSLAVQLGDFLGRESYYYAFVTLHEYKPGSLEDRSYTLPKRLFHGFLWAAGWWFAVAAAAGLCAGAAVSVQTLWPGRRVA